MKILVNNYASLVESRVLKLEPTYVVSKADTIVNPTAKHLLGKTLIFNLPIEIPSESLLEYCTVYSRFPLGYGIPVIPFELPEDRKDIPIEDYSLCILTPEIMMDSKYANFIDKNNFLIGITESIDNHYTVVGYTILTNKIENL